jgi:hypothetical protein
VTQPGWVRPWRAYICRRSRAYLRELPKTWAKAKGGKGRAMLATALFDRIDVLGKREATVYLSAESVRHGLGAVIPAELDSLVSGRGDGT